MITQYKIGSQTLDLIQHVLSKGSEPQEISSRQSSASNSSNPSSASGSRNLESPLLTRELKTNKKQSKNIIRKQNQLLYVSFYLLLNLSEDPKLEIKIVKKGVIDHLVKTLDRMSDVELLIIALKFLLKLSIYAENKDSLAGKAVMEKLFVLFSFASKCSEINQEFMTAILSVIYNLSFDEKLVKNLIQVGMVPKLLLFWCRNKTPIKKSLEQNIIKILYQISRERTSRSSFDFSPSVGVESIDMLMTKLLRTLEVPPTNRRPTTSRNVKSLCPIELITLAINLALDYKIAIKMAHDGRLSSLLEYAYGNIKLNESIDVVTVYVVKVIRNLSDHTHEFKSQFVPFVERISTVVFETNVVESNLPRSRKSRKQAQRENVAEDASQTLLIESLSILGNLSDVQVEWLDILRKLNAFEWLMSKLTVQSDCEDDLILEVIIFLGTVCSQEECASHFVANNGMDLVTEMLERAQEDDEIVLQTLFLINVVAEHQILKQEMTGNSKLSSLLLELMNDNNTEIKKLASAIMDIFSNSHQVWANKVRMESFRTHNQQWLEMIQSSDDYGDELLGELVVEQDSDQEVELYDVLRSELLNSSLDSLQGSKSGSPLSSIGEVDGNRSKTPQRPVTGYGRR